jgi:hypothetical protein
MAKQYQHKLSIENEGGWEFHGHQGWRPIMAHPLYVGFGLKKAKCGCGRVFKNVDDFYAHYLYMAVWKGESTVLPVEWRDLVQPTESEEVK